MIKQTVFPLAKKSSNSSGENNNNSNAWPLVIFGVVFLGITFAIIRTKKSEPIKPTIN